MPGYRVGVFRKRHHYRPNRRLVVRRVASVVGEACRAKLAGVDRAVFLLLAEVVAGYEANQRQPFILPGVQCREDV